MTPVGWMVSVLNEELTAGVTQLQLCQRGILNPRAEHAPNNR